MWLRNIIVLIPKKKVIDRLEGQTTGICVQSVVFAKWYCGCLTFFAGNGDEEHREKLQELGMHPHLWF